MDCSKPFCTILHVDDDVNMLNSVRRQLRKEPYQVVSVRTAKDALKLSKLLRFDLAVLDVNLSGTNGFRLLKKLRAQQQQLPVIFLSGLQEECLFYRAFPSPEPVIVQKQESALNFKNMVKTILKNPETHPEV
ncbi:MAG: response regulator [Vampirovibrionales bacterium]|nr:response regulator [Vampirovibrionales bacterium]